MLKNPFSLRLIKKVQTTHPTDGYPAARDARCEAYLVRTSQPGTHLMGVERANAADGPFSAAF